MISHLNYFILRTWFVPFMGMFLFVSALFLIQKITIWLPKIIEHDAPIDLVLSLFTAMMPIELSLLIPMAYFFAVIKLTRELQTNSEIDAMYAGGLSLYNIFTPAFWVGVVLTVLMFWISMDLAPAGKVAAYNLAAELSTLKAEPTFQPKKFVTGIDDLVFYFEGHNPDGSYARIMLSDSRLKTDEPNIYFAESATISRIDSGLMLSMFNGSQLSGGKHKLRSTNFSHYNVEVPINIVNTHYVVTSSDSPSYMGGKELLDSLSQPDVSPKHVAHWHYRLVSSLSVLLLFLFAVPLSLQAKRSKQNGVYLMAIGIMVAINQTELMLLNKVASNALPWWSFWGVLLLFAGIGIRMFNIVNQRGSFSFSMLWRR